MPTSNNGLVYMPSDWGNIIRVFGYDEKVHDLREFDQKLGDHLRYTYPEWWEDNRVWSEILAELPQDEMLAVIVRFKLEG